MKKSLFFLLLLVTVTVLISSCIKRNEKKSGALTPRPVVSEESTFTRGPGDYDFSFEQDGILRTYAVHVPPDYDRATKTPVVIYIHGGGGSSAASQNDGLYAYSDTYGFILISPAGTGALQDKFLVWNLGPSVIDGVVRTRSNYASEHNVDEVAFFSKMIDEIKTNFNVDEARIYATGISQGGMMSYRLACELSGTIAAVAPVAAPAVPMNCAPSRSVAIMHIHGTADPCTPFNGGNGKCLLAEKDMFQSAQEMVSTWLRINACPSETSVAYQNGDATCLAHEPCTEGTEVQLCSITGMGHTFPSGSQYLPPRMIGPVSHDISFDQIWEFFKKHPMHE